LELDAEAEITTYEEIAIVKVILMVDLREK